MMAIGCSLIVSVPLVAQDTNGQQDVYEWEREGTGSCTLGAGVNGGCVYLLSGGDSGVAVVVVGCECEWE